MNIRELEKTKLKLNIMLNNEQNEWIQTSIKQVIRTINNLIEDLEKHSKKD